MGLEVTEDDAAEASGAECGNLLARLPGRGERTILLCAHLDTVDDGGVPVDPVVVDGGWENANAGDPRRRQQGRRRGAPRARARRCSVEGSPVGIELLFTVSEENALAGAKEFDASALQSEFGYVFDHATPIGEIITASPTYFRIAADFHGRAAHAGIRPEDGRSRDPRRRPRDRRDAAGPHRRRRRPRTSARSRAAAGSHQHRPGALPAAGRDALARPRDGRGRRGQDRRRHPRRRRPRGVRRRRHARSGCSWATAPSRLSPWSQAAEAALRACGYEPRRIVTGGGSDANALEVIGFQCVNLANGTERAHEPTERVSRRRAREHARRRLRPARRGRAAV